MNNIHLFAAQHLKGLRDTVQGSTTGADAAKEVAWLWADIQANGVPAALNIAVESWVPKIIVTSRAAQESEIPNFKGSDLGHFPLVSADFWTSDHLSERSRRVGASLVTRARGTLTLKRR
jgi:hypothetical protein